MQLGYAIFSNMPKPCMKPLRESHENQYKWSHMLFSWNMWCVGVTATNWPSPYIYFAYSYTEYKVEEQIQSAAKVWEVMCCEYEIIIYLMAILIRRWAKANVQVQLNIKNLCIHTLLASPHHPSGLFSPHLGKQILFMGMNNWVYVRISLSHALMEVHINISKY